MGRDLVKELLEALDGWQDQHVAVRVVASTDDLVAVFSGRLGARSGAKGSSLFWPVELDGAARGLLEQPGVYAHPALLSDVRLHVGGFVVEFMQAGVTVNVRRLDRP
jgi:hypothetical protein